MLIFYNGEIMSNVSLLRDKDNSASYLEYLGWRYYQSSKAKESKDNLLPCISLPNFTKDETWENCNVGYIDVETMEFTTSAIVLDYIAINGIEVCKKNGHKKNKIGDFESEYNCTEYYYKIDISFLDKDKNTIFNYVFQSYDIIWHSRYLDKKERKKHSKTIKYLFTVFPEIIRTFIEKDYYKTYFYKIPLSLFNMDILQKEWPNKDIYDYKYMVDSQNYLFDRNDRSNSPYTLDKAILTLFSIKVEKQEDGIMIKIGNGELIYLNVYFEKFFEFAFEQKLLYDKNNRVAYCHFKGNIPFNLSSNDDIAAYIACAMHLYMYKYFDLEASRQLYLVNIPQNFTEYNEVSLSLGRMVRIDERIDIEEDFFNIYRFMYYCKIEHKQYGYYRVGKDDSESQVKTYEFRPRKGKMAKSFIDKIDTLLQTKLTYEKEETGRESHPERYYYRNEYFHDYVAGLAESKDLGSIELRDESFLFISNYFIKEYLIDREDFKRFYN